MLAHHSEHLLLYPYKLDYNIKKIKLLENVKLKMNISYQCPNGKGCLSHGEVIEFCLVFVELLICSDCISSAVFSFADLIRDRRRRGFRFCTQNSSSLIDSLSIDDDLLILFSFVSSKKTRVLILFVCLFIYLYSLIYA
jgi:hypothetical protein